MIVSTSVDPSCRTRKCRASARSISILQPGFGIFKWPQHPPTRSCPSIQTEKRIPRPEVATLPQRIASSNHMLRISPRPISINHPARGWQYLPALNSVFRLESSELLLDRSQSSGQKFKLSQAKWHSPTGSSKLHQGSYRLIIRPEDDSCYQR